MATTSKQCEFTLPSPSGKFMEYNCAMYWHKNRKQFWLSVVPVSKIVRERGSTIRTLVITAGRNAYLSNPGECSKQTAHGWAKFEGVARAKAPELVALLEGGDR